MTLREFARPHLHATHDTRTRIISALLTGILYAGLAFLAWLPLRHPPLPSEPEVTASLRPRAEKRVIEPPSVHMLTPRAENLPTPVITIAPEAPPQLSASATQTSPLTGGVSGNGRAGSGAGGGNGGGGAGGCLDAVWMRAVTERVRQFFYYPLAALSVRKTGLVMVHFVVRRNGQIETLAIAKSSGDAGLDKAALDIVQKAQPLPPIPDRMQAVRIDGELPVNFGVRGFNGESSTGTCN